MPAQTYRLELTANEISALAALLIYAEIPTIIAPKITGHILPIGNKIAALAPEIFRADTSALDSATPNA